MEQLKVFSFGGGVQSTACMVLAAQGKIDYKVFLFADTGDEHPETYDYLENVHKPFAEKHGLELHCLKRTWRDGSQYSIRENIDRLKSAIPIPVYLESGMPRQRHCTADWKINVVYKWEKQHGATGDSPALCGLGISTDEIQRIRTSIKDFQINDYPLIDLRLTRNDCHRIVKEAGLPQAPRSACFYCPYHSTDYWLDLREQRPDLFEQAVELEAEMSKRTQKAFGSTARLWRKGSLSRLPDQIRFDFIYNDEDEPETCDTGNCFL